MFYCVCKSSAKKAVYFIVSLCIMGWSWLWPCSVGLGLECTGLVYIIDFTLSVMSAITFILLRNDVINFCYVIDV